MKSKPGWATGRNLPFNSPAPCFLQLTVYDGDRSTCQYLQISPLILKEVIIAWIKTYLGLPSRSSGDESTCQCRGHGFDPRSWKIPHAVGQQSPRAHVLQEKPPQWEAQAPQLESSPLPLQLEQARVQEQRPSAATNKYIKTYLKKTSVTFSLRIKIMVLKIELSSFLKTFF